MSADSFYAKWQGMFERTEDEIAKKQGELERHRKEVAQIMEEYQSLQSDLEAAKMRLKLTAEQARLCKDNLEQMQKGIVECWGNPDAHPNGPDYREIVASKAAMEDYSRVRSVLTGRVRSIELLIEQFEKTHATIL